MTKSKNKNGVQNENKQPSKDDKKNLTVNLKRNVRRVRRQIVVAHHSQM